MNAAADPVTRGAVAVRLLQGLSGAHVYLLTKDGHHWFVRKAAPDPAGNGRLRRQAERQRALATCTPAAPVRTPRVLHEGENHGRYFFDMEMVRGTDAASFLRAAPYASVRRFADHLCEYLQWAAVSSALAAAPESFLEACLSRIEDAQRTADAAYARTLQRLSELFESRASSLRRPPTFCHGDLTLDNLLVADDGSLCVVDLLDGPLEHYWQDAAKLNQDLRGEWYRRRLPSISPAILHHIDQRVTTLCAQLDPSYGEVQDLLVALQFVRILPYVRSDSDRRLVSQRIEHFADRAIRAGKER